MGYYCRSTYEGYDWRTQVALSPAHLHDANTALWEAARSLTIAMEIATSRWIGECEGYVSARFSLGKLAPFEAIELAGGGRIEAESDRIFRSMYSKSSCQIALKRMPELYDIWRSTRIKQDNSSYMSLNISKDDARLLCIGAREALGIDVIIDAIDSGVPLEDATA